MGLIPVIASTDAMVTTAHPPRRWPSRASQVPMSARAYLERIGRDLDRQIFPRVLNGGIVAPSDDAVPYSLGEEIAHDRSERFSTGPWQGAPQGSPASAGTPGAASPLQCTGPPGCYEVELDGVRAAYPDALVWREDDGLWLLTRSEVIPNIARAATFLTAISYKHALVRAWGFWRSHAVGVEWIGPRHTNFPDGSICAFAPNEGTWTFGDSLVTLLDLYTVWAFRHLHLAVVGRWPGPQVAFHPYERLIEFGMDEDCGCGSGSVYGQCCFPNDHARRRLADAVNFTVQFTGALRSPPSDVVRAVLERSQPPSLAQVTCPM